MEKAWLARYLVHFNAKRAAEEVGYKWPGRVGWQKKQKFAKEIEAAIEEMTLEAEEALAKLSAQASVDYSQYVTGRGSTLAIDVEKLKEDGLGHLIREVYQTKEGPRVKLADPDWALELVLKHRTKGPAGTKDDPQYIAVVNADAEELQ